MSTFFVLAAILCVAAVLTMGLVNMMRGGSPQRSQRLMRWRVGLQAVAIVVIMLAFWAKSTGN